MSKKFVTPVVAEVAQTCPGCGGRAWSSAPLTVEITEAGDHAARQAAIDAVEAERGARLTCDGCGYVRHAHDDLTPIEG